ncbi:MAG: HIT domain-containing protein [Acidimicrobiales bacterium]
MTLDQLWAGWRQAYVVQASDAHRSGKGHTDTDDCVFCRIIATGAPSEDNGIVYRGDLACAMLNAYPYATGHLLVMPIRHVGDLPELTPQESGAVWETARTAVQVLTDAYVPDGANLGANLGRAAGAGIPSHLHLHVLPRWSGDTNFMTSIAGVRVMPESLTDTWVKVHAAWEKRAV